MKNKMTRSLIIVLMIFILTLSACTKSAWNSVGETALPTEQTVLPTEIPQKTLIICLGEEPQSLYLYANSSRAMWSVLEAIYDGPIDTVNYEPSPVILDSLPTLENGGVVLRSVPVTAGDEVANVNGDLVALQKGVRVFAEGCSSAECATEWDGVTPLNLNQMVVKFSLMDGVKWSDGEPLTAADSVFSYTVSKDPATAVSRSMINRTFSYTAVDTKTVEWVGKPGYLTLNPSAFFWIPLPQHQLADLSPEEMNSAQLTTRFPLGWGPYQVDEWVANDHIRLVKNPLYYRVNEGLPKFDVVVYRFLNAFPEPDLSPVATGECDIIDTSVPLETQIQPIRIMENDGKVKTYFATGPEWEGLNFGIQPASYDAVYNPYLDRQDLFGDVRVRQAFAYCIDRDKINKDVLFSKSQVPTTFLPPAHPYAFLDVQDYPHDPLIGAQLLEDAGWLDADANPDTPRTASGVANVFDGTKFEISYFVTESELHAQTSQIVVDSLAACGISATVEYLPVEEMFAPGPEGKVFGRDFDLAELAWSTGRQLPCFLYASSEIPTEKNSWLGTKFGGVNLTGYSNQEYDAACSSLLESGLDQDGYVAQSQEIQKILSQDLPVLPLFYHVKAMVSRVDLCGLTLDVSSRSPLNSIEILDYETGCQP